MKVESPSLLGTTISTGILLPTPGSPNPYWTYRVDLIGCHPSGVDNQDILITVASKDGDYSMGYDNTPTNFKGTNSKLCAYQIYTPSVSPDVPPENLAIQVSTPNGGEVWNAGSSQNITWSSIGTIPNVKIEYSSTGLSGPWLAIDGEPELLQTPAHIAGRSPTVWHRQICT